MNYRNDLESPKSIVIVRIIEIIESSKWIHFENNSLKRLINNFSNIYKCKESTDKLVDAYNKKLETFENN